MAISTKVKYFTGALCVALILIGMICGFVLVDLSSDRYMPGMLPPIYLINYIGPDGAYFYLMGQAYRLEIEYVMQLQRVLWDFRGFLPRSIRLAGGLATLVANGT